MPVATSADGTPISWTEVGDGPPVALVHGLTECSAVWDPIVDRLAGDRRVITLDLRGHGRSPHPATGDYGDAALAADLAAVLDAAEVDGAAHLVGHSLGGLVVAAVAASHPVASVVVVDQPLRLGGFREQVAWFEAELRDPATFPAVMAAVFEFSVGERLPADEKQRIAALRRADQEVVLGVWSFRLETPPAEVEAAIDQAITPVIAGPPHLTLLGTRPDPDYPAWLAQRIPGAVVEVWEGHGHYPHLVDPDRFTDRLRALWAGKAPSLEPDDDR